MKIKNTVKKIKKEKELPMLENWYQENKGKSNLITRKKG